MVCQSPFVLPVRVPGNRKDYRLHEVVCWKCKGCRTDRVRDWVGRCMCEARTSDYSVGVTLTYEGDLSDRSALVYADVQRMLDSMRTAGRRSGDYSVRYLVTGEYCKSGRAHWHILLFFKGRNFPVPVNLWMPKGDKWRFWDHGWAAFTPFSEESAGYVCKYLLKDEDAENRLHCSLRPGLGDEYLQGFAASLVEAGLPFQRFFQFESCRMRPGRGGVGRRTFEVREGRMRRFYLRGRALDWALLRYVNGWQERYGRYPALLGSEFGILSRFIDGESDSNPARMALRLELKLPRPGGLFPCWADLEGYAARKRSGKLEMLGRFEAVGLTCELFEDGTAKVLTDGRGPSYRLDAGLDLAAWDRQISRLDGVDTADKSALHAWVAARLAALPQGRFKGFYAPQQAGESLPCCGPRPVRRPGPVRRSIGGAVSVPVSPLRNPDRKESDGQFLAVRRGLVRARLEAARDGPAGAGFSGSGEAVA